MRIVALLALALLVPARARADLVVPQRAACDGKRAGDACDGGTCVSAGFSCEAGACRRFDAREPCEREGCSWVEQLRCAPTSPSTAAPTPPSTPSTPPPATTPPPGSCATGSAAMTLALAALLLRRGRARHSAETGPSGDHR